MKQGRRKAHRCSFCEKLRQGDARLVTSISVAICDGCLDLCANILTKERESRGSQARGWESWSSEAVTADIDAFHKSQGRLAGVSERTLARRLGPPDEISGGMKVCDRFGNLVWSADRAFEYLRLLPRTVVRFDLLDGKVRQVSFAPKWKRYPTARRAKLRNRYAPESVGDTFRAERKRQQLMCAFCKRDHRKVAKLFAGPKHSICGAPASPGTAGVQT